MGYYTSYTLEWEKSPQQQTPEWIDLVSKVGEEQAQLWLDNGVLAITRYGSADPISEWIQGHDDASYALNADGTTQESSKWYEHEDDLRELSARHPDTLLTLSGEGEEAGDIWVKYFLNGEMQECKAKITFEPCTLRQEAK
jgi:hypothetical protein